MTEQALPIQPIEAYGKQVRNKAQQSINKAQIPFVLGEKDKTVLRDRDLLHHFPEVSFTEDMIRESAAFNHRLPQVLEGLLMQPPSVGKQEKYMHGIGGYDFENLPRAAVALAQTSGSREQVVSRVVFGVTTEMPLRGISYLLPALQQMERITHQVEGQPESPKPPQLQVVFMNNVGASVGEYDYEAIHAQSQLFAEVTQSYVSQAFPELVDYLVFLEDAPLIEGSLIRHELERLSEITKDQIPAVLRERILAKGNGTPGDKKLTYAGAHLLPHDTNNPELFRAFPIDQPEVLVPDIILNGGGLQEKDFYDTRFTLKPYAGEAYNSVPTVQFIYKHSVPPYSAAREGDISLESVLEGNTSHAGKVDPLALHDLNYLQAVSTSHGLDIFSFLEDERRKRNK